MTKGSFSTNGSNLFASSCLISIDASVYGVNIGFIFDIDLLSLKPQGKRYLWLGKNFKRLVIYFSVRMYDVALCMNSFVVKAKLFEISSLKTNGSRTIENLQREG